ncbi:MAG: outer membrane protein assembly factor BamD [Alphaproteobacteria bacterium]
MTRQNTKKAGWFIAGLMVLSTVSACSTSGEDDYVELPVDQIYNSAQSKLSGKDYKNAAKGFEEVERQHPYSQWAKRSMVMAAYSYYEAGKYDDAISQGKRFISLHPGDRDAAYAQYLIATSYYDQIVDVNRDQQLTRDAMREFRELVRKYPDSDYARDARLKIELTIDHLAGKEMQIGRYYLNKKAYLAAINRFKVVVKSYQTTTQVEEALMRLTEAYMALGVTSEAQTAAAVLGFNYPGSKWYEDAYILLKSDGLAPREDKGSWISRTWKTVSPV